MTPLCKLKCDKNYKENSWKVVYIQAMQSRTPFILTNYSDRNFKVETFNSQNWQTKIRIYLAKIHGLLGWKAKPLTLGDLVSNLVSIVNTHREFFSIFDQWFSPINLTKIFSEFWRVKSENWVVINRKVVQSHFRPIRKRNIFHLFRIFRKEIILKN